MELETLLTAFTLSKTFNVKDNHVALDFLDTTVKLPSDVPDGDHYHVKSVIKKDGRLHYSLLGVSVYNETVLLYETVLPDGYHPTLPYEDQVDVESFVADVVPWLDKAHVNLLAYILNGLGVLACAELPVDYRYMHNLAIERFDFKHQYSHEQYSALTGNYNGHKYILPLDYAIVTLADLEM